MTPNDLYAMILGLILLLGFGLPVLLEAINGRSKPLMLAGFYVSCLYGAVFGACALFNLLH